MALNRELLANCRRFLSGHPPKAPRAWPEELAASSIANLPRDWYGEGPAMALLEQEVAALLGKEAALFVHKIAGAIKALLHSAGASTDET
jgi:threonine aldolase